LVGRFVDKLVDGFCAGDVPEAIVLVNNATETRWFATLVEHATAVCFPVGRVRFWGPNNEVATPLQGQAVVYLGPHATDFREEFGPFGWTAQL